MQIMKSDTYNHSADYYAVVSVQDILSNVGTPELRQNMKNTLVEFFNDAIELEKNLLIEDPAQCEKDLTNVGNFFAETALIAFERFMKPQDPEWTNEIKNYLATNIRTAMHLERLEFAKQNPGNIAAHHYKSKFGVI